MFNWFKRKKPGTCQCGHLTCFHIAGVYRCMEIGEDGHQCRCVHCVEVEVDDVKALERMIR